MLLSWLQGCQCGSVDRLESAGMCFKCVDYTANHVPGKLLEKNERGWKNKESGEEEKRREVGGAESYKMQRNPILLF